MHLVEPTPEYIAAGLQKGASDWHLAVGGPVFCRINGELRPLSAYAPTHDEICAFVGPEANEMLQSLQCKSKHVDGSFTAANEFFRFTLFYSRGKLTMTIRHLQRKIRSLKELGVPSKFIDLLDRRAGIVLVTGPTGSGKSTTLTAAVDHINNTQAGVMITLEDPIEYVHESKKCLIRQRQFRNDFASFPEAISAAMRQDPDYIMVGEMRDYQTISAALQLAETGHLVLSTLHSATAADAVTRILDAVPENDKGQQRAILSKSLVGILAQQLLPTVEGRRIGCFELLVNNISISSLIRESRFANIVSDISTGSRDGMISMDQSIEELFRESRITREVALAAATNPKFLADKLPRVSPARRI